MAIARTLGFVVVLSGLGIGLWWTSREVPRATFDGRAVLGGRSLAGAASFSFRRDKGVLPLEFERDPSGEWYVTDPVHDLASVAIVDALQTAFDRALLVPGYPPEEITPDLLMQTGLDDPRAEIEVRWPDGTAVALQLGLEGPLGDDLFARRTEAGADGRIDRVDRSLLNALQINPTEAREALVFRNDAVQVREIRVARRLPQVSEPDVLEMVRQGSTTWRIVVPHDLRADDARAMTFAASLLSLRVERFIPGDPAADGTLGPEAPDDVVVEIDGGRGKETLTVRLNRSSGSLLGHVMPRDIWFLCGSREFDAVIELPLRELRARWLFAVQIEDARTVRILDPTRPTPFELARDGLGTLAIVRPVACGVFSQASSELIQAFHSMGALDFVADGVTDFAPYGLGETALRVEVVGRGSTTETVLIGSDTGEAEAYARRGDEPQVVTIPREVAARLRRPWTDYVDRRLLSIESSALLGRVRRELPDGSAIVLERGADGRFQRPGAVGPTPELEASIEVLRELHADLVLGRDALPAVVPAGRLLVSAPSGQVLGEFELWEGPDHRAWCAIPRVAGVVFRLSARDSRDVLALK